MADPRIPEGDDSKAGKALDFWTTSWCKGVVKLDGNGIPILSPPRKKKGFELLPKSYSLAEAEQRMCRDKRPFATEGEALSCNRGQRAYKCPVCDLWHLTSVKIRVEGR